MHQVKLKIHLSPVFHAEPPQGRLSAGGTVIDFVLVEPQTFEFDFFATESSSLRLDFLNKKDQDCLVDQGLDKAIVIDWISFFDIADPRFVWNGEYCPDYPEPWHSQQIVRPAKTIKNCNYIGWNGRWQLDFTVPIFTWMHQTMDLGWLYQ